MTRKPWRLTFRLYRSAGRVYSTTRAEGAEILRFTAAFLRGLGFFSLSDLATHPTLFSRSYLGAAWIPSGTSAFAAAP